MTGGAARPALLLPRYRFEPLKLMLQWRVRILLLVCWIAPGAFVALVSRRSALVAGDVFAVEDRLGTWRHLLVAARPPHRIFVAKALASLSVIMLLVAGLAVTGVVGRDGAVPDDAHPEQLNRYTWYQTHDWKKPYPGDTNKESLPSRRRRQRCDQPVPITIWTRLSKPQ